jgi:protein-S-isoprenylcysteine O-methyltransferase Ste14
MPSGRRTPGRDRRYAGNMTGTTMKAVRAVLVAVVAIAALLFVAAGTLHYWQAWMYLAVYLVSSLIITLDLVRTDPKLLERRMRGGPFAEKQRSQKIIMSLTSMGFVALMIVPGLDRRFAWSHMPPYLSLAGVALVVLGFVAVYFVFKANSFAAATIELAADQQVISTGPYAWARHPMYAGGLVLLAGIPLALGSWWGLLVLVAILPALIWRMIDEENFLIRSLPGYREYLAKVRYRLVPGVW